MPAPAPSSASFAGEGAGSSGAFGAGTAGSSLGGIITAGVSFYEYLRNPKKFFIENPFQGFEDLVAEGIPVREKTIEAVLRLGESANPVVKQFGRDLATLEGGGVVLSTSGGAGRAALNKIYAKAVTGLESQGFSKQDANRLLVNVLSSHTATPGSAIPASPNSVLPLQARGFPAAPPRPVPQVGNVSPMGTPVNYFPTSAQDFSNQFISSIPSQIGNIVKDVTGVREVENLARDLTGQNITIPTFPDLLQAGQNIGTRIGNYIAGQPSPFPNLPPPTVPPGTIVNPQPERQPMEIIDPRDCPQCNPQQAQEKQTLERQQADLQRELQTEQSQRQQQQDQQRQRQIDKFRDLEKQPADQRNIPDEIQQKMNALNQIGQELADLQREIDQTPVGGNPPPAGQGSYPSPASTTTPGAGGGPQTIYGQDEPTPGTEDEHQHELEEEQIFIQKQPVGQAGDPTQAVKFCVGCVTQIDAIKFLNGEPSACSVMEYPS